MTVKIILLACLLTLAYTFSLCEANYERAIWETQRYGMRTSVGFTWSQCACRNGGSDGH